jgi:DNA-binding response OmpR family regulator
MAKILVVEDDVIIARGVEEYLRSEGHTVDLSADGESALDFLSVSSYDLLILDWQLPGIQGVDVCRTFRDKGEQAPVIMLTALSSIGSKEQGFDAGADDYLTKPFEMRELRLRVRALLKRPSAIVENQIKLGPYDIDLVNRRVCKNSKELALSPKEFDVLQFFLQRPQQIVNPESLLARVWSGDSEAAVDTVYTCLNRLRKKLDPADKNAVIETVHGFGYRLRD